MPARAFDPSEYTCTRRFEAIALRKGWRVVAGCDEAGRGSLVGPLYAAAVILDPAQRIRRLDDSKKLTPEQREELDVKIRERAIAFHVISVSREEIEAINVYQASRQAMIRALTALAPNPDFVLTDAMRLAGWGDAFEFPIPYRAIIHGDARSVSIAAASILAKVARDAYMRELDLMYPQYLLAKNKGYYTPEHLQALARYGPCPEHRKTFEPVKYYSVPPLFASGSEA